MKQLDYDQGGPAGQTGRWTGFTQWDITPQMLRFVTLHFGRIPICFFAPYQSFQQKVGNIGAKFQSTGLILESCVQSISVLLPRGNRFHIWKSPGPDERHAVHMYHS